MLDVLLVLDVLEVEVPLVPLVLEVLEVLDVELVLDKLEVELVPDELMLEVLRSARAEDRGAELAQTERRLRHVGVYVEVEVHADRLEEVVVDRDKPAFDGNLEVLQPPQLLQEVADFVVDLFV